MSLSYTVELCEATKCWSEFTDWLELYPVDG